MSSKVRILVLLITISAASVIVGLIVIRFQQQQTIIFRSVVNEYDVVIIQQYIDLQKDNPGLPRYISPCADSVLQVEKEGHILTTGISSVASQAFRTEDSLIIVGVGCYSEDETIKAWNVNVRKHDLADLSLKSHTAIPNSSSNFKAYVENGELVVLVQSNVTDKLIIDLKDLSQINVATLTVEEYGKVEKSRIFYLSELKAGGDDVKGIVLNALVGEKKVELGALQSLQEK